MADSIGSSTGSTGHRHAAAAAQSSASAQSPPTAGTQTPAVAAPQPAPTPAAHHVPVWGQALIETGLGHLYGITVGPWLRQETQKLIGAPYTPAYKPTNTPGFIAREAVVDIAETLIGNGLMGFMLRKTAGDSGAVNSTVSVNGLAGVNAASAAGMSVNEASHAFRLMVGRNLVMCAAMTALDAVFAAHIGTMIESTVNNLFGVKKKTTTTKDLRGGVDMSTVKQTFEQASRVFMRSFLASTSYTILWREVGMGIAESVFAEMGGPIGAVVAAFAGSMITSLMNHVVLWGLAEGADDMAQRGARLLKLIVHKPLDTTTPPDVVTTIGDRVSGTVASVLIPFGVALSTGQTGAFIAGLVPRKG